MITVVAAAVNRGGEAAIVDDDLWMG